MNLLKPMIAVSSALLVLVACDGRGPLFYAELEEPRLCKTIPAEDLPPFQGTAPGAELRYRVPIPIASELPLFAGAGDGGTADTETEIRLIEFTLVARSGITDFNQIETSRITIEPPPGSALPPEILITYERDPSNLPGDRLVVGGDEGVNLLPYLFDPTGSTDAGIPDGIDGGAFEEGSVLVEATMSGVLPENPWTADLRACIYMRTRFNYLNAYGF